MDGLTILLAYVLSAMGLAVLIVWPADGPMAWLRDRVLRPMLPKAVQGVLDCYVCLGFWTGLILSVVFWIIYGYAWLCFGCLVVPAVFWLIVGQEK